MAEILCPNCGRGNPDLLDLCQFCQTPLTPDSVLRIGEKPTKKNTGELESVLPDWLKDVRQQAKESAEQEAAETARTSPPADEPPDLLAGLASQSGSADDEEVPDWLAGIRPAPRPESAPTGGSGSDFFAQFDAAGSREKAEPESRPDEESFSPGGRSDLTPDSSEKDELSAWFAQASGQPDEFVDLDGEQSDAGWGSRPDRSSAPAQKSPAEEEDLGWLRDLEAAAKQTGDLQPPKQQTDWTANFETPSAPVQSPDDLSWLDRLGGIDETAQARAAQPSATDADPGGRQDTPPPSQSSSSGEDLSWLSDLGTVTEKEPPAAAPPQPAPFASADEQPDWLKPFGGTGETRQPESAPDEKRGAAEDLSWLESLGKPQEPGTVDMPFPGESQDRELPGQPEGASGPFTTSPFSAIEAEPAAIEEAEPDWLKQAAEPPSMPAPGDLSLDWFSGSTEGKRESSTPSVPQGPPPETDIFAAPAEAASLSNDDVDSLFSVEMPDWLSQPGASAAEPSSPQSEISPGEGAESLSPVDLPSWVQAMRPVEAVITDSTPGSADLPAETEGPLAGLHGVIPITPIGLARRPKPVSLTLQASDEQQASAILLEQILASETSPRALITAPVVASQQWLRWALTGLFLLVLSGTILLGSQRMPISANLPAEVGGVSNAVVRIPANARILVVMDYEPSHAGEMEALAAPLLDQIVLLSQPSLSFVSTSPNGAALVDRLLMNAGIHQAGEPYLNLGYLPGGPAGVLGFIEAPGQIVPAAGPGMLSDYSALLLITDNAESGRAWVEQLQGRRTSDPALASQPLLVVASAQASPLLRPYVSSQQIAGLIGGLADAARYEFLNNSRPGLARAYWDTFGVGMMTSVLLIVVGSLWSLLTGMRARRGNAEQG